MKQAIANTSEMNTTTTLRRTKRDKASISERIYVLDYDDDEIRCGIMNGTIPSTVADSGCTYNVGTKDDPFKRTSADNNHVFNQTGWQTKTPTKKLTKGLFI